MADIYPAKDLERLLGFDAKLEADDVAPREAVDAVAGKIDDQAQKRPVEPEDVHPDTIGRDVLGFGVADLPDRQLVQRAVVEDLRLRADWRAGVDRGKAHRFDRRRPELGTPGPVGVHRTADRGMADQRQRQPPLGDAKHPVNTSAERAGARAERLQLGKIEGLDRFGGPIPAPQRTFFEKSEQFIPPACSWPILPSPSGGRQRASLGNLAGAGQTSQFIR